MRARLIAIFTVPVLLLFVFLGAAYAVSEARANQQELFLDRLGDAGYLAIAARQSLAADDPDIVQAELQRYGDVYGIEAAVINQSGETWATNGLDAGGVDVRFEALAGRNSEPEKEVLPWQIGDLELAAPVFDGGDLVGAVVTSSDTGHLSRNLWLMWAALLVGGLAAFGVTVAIASGLASWVLRPVRAVDGAMAEIGRGELGARIPESTGPPELKQVITRFNQMADKVESLMHKQQEFVSNASHELRNPLNALLLRVEDLALALPQKDADELEYVRSEGRRMTRILDALLTLARDEDAGADLDSVEVCALVAGRVDAWGQIARDHEVEFAVSGADTAWAAVNAIVLESAFDAVVDNAIKFSGKGSVVGVSVGDVDGMIEVGVRDQGPGLSPDEIEKVTDRFWRSSQHIGVRGSGLGLAIAAELLESSGGDLRVTRPEGSGLLVTLRVPASEDTP